MVCCLLGCRKDAATPPWTPPYFAAPQELKDMYKFKPGTWWIYKCKQDGRLDTLVVMQLDTGTVLDYTYDKQKPSAKLEAFATLMASSQKYNLTFWNHISARERLGLNTDNFAKAIVGGAKRARDGNSGVAMLIPFYAVKLGGDGCVGYFRPCTIHATYKIGDTTYTNVRETVDSNSCAYGYHHVHLFTVPHIGEVKIEVQKNPNGRTWDYGAASVWAPITWELVQYHIVQ